MKNLGRATYLPHSSCSNKVERYASIFEEPHSVRDCTNVLAEELLADNSTRKMLYELQSGMH